MTPIKKRLKQLRSALGLSHTVMAKKLESVSSRTYSYWESPSKPDPKLRNIDLICAKFPQVNKDWLLSGHGSMFKENMDKCSYPEKSETNLPREREIENKYGLDKKLIKQAGLTQAQLAEKVGITRQYLNQIFNGQTEASDEVIGKIKNELGIEKKHPQIKTPSVPAEDPKEVELPYFPQGVPCGNCRIVFDDCMEKISIPAAMARNVDFVVRASGNSMRDLGIVEDGKLLVKKQNHLDRNGDVMIVQIHADGIVCRKVFLDSEHGEYVLKSANPDYEDIRLGVSAMAFLGKVVSVYTVF